MEENIVNLGKNIVLYNLKTLEQIFQETKDVIAGQKTPTDEDNKVKNEWRYLPTQPKECMIIASGGECRGPSVVPKQRDNTQSDNDPQLLRRELDVVQEKMRQDDKYHVVQVCVDYPGVEMSRDYYLEKIKQLMTGCKRPGVTIWYTGHGERGTGNWCFKDGVISFEDIFALYMDHCRGKMLTMICDCSYSGSWVEHCAKKLDEIGIPSCGHHTREQGILISVFCSCKDDQQATMLAYCEEAIYINMGLLLYRHNGRKIKEDQQTVGAFFTDVRCRKEKECEIPAHHTWIDRLFNSRYVYRVRGKDKDKPAWHYVLVDKEKVEQFKAKIKTGTIDVADYGKVLCSGWGEEPPKDKTKQIDDQFTQYLKRE